MSKGAYHPDVIDLAIQSQKLLDTGIIGMHLQYGCPVSIIIGAAFILFTKLLGINDPIFALNLMSITFGSLAVMVFYMIVNNIFDKKTAVLAAISLCLSPIFLSVSAYGKTHTLALYFLFLTIHYLLTFNNNGKSRYLMYSAFCLGLLGATRFQDMILTVIPILLFYIFKITNINDPDAKPKTNYFKSNFLFFLFSIYGFLFSFHIPYILNPKLNFIKNIISYKSSQLNNDGSLSQLFLLSKTFNMLLTEYFLIGIFIALFGLTLIYKKHKKLGLLFTIWIISNLYIFSILPMTVPRFLFVLFPCFYILQAYFFNVFSRKNWIFNILCFLIFFAMIIMKVTSIYPILSFRHQHAVLPEYCRWVKSVTPKNAMVISGDDRLFFEYYGKMKFLSKNLKTFSIDSDEIASFKKQLDHNLDNNIPIYITDIGLYAYDPDKKFSTFIKNNYKLQFIGTHLYEDWHKGAFKQQLFNLPLYKVNRKK